MKQSVKELYDNKIIGKNDVYNAISKKMISVEDAVSIINEPEITIVEVVRLTKLKEISKICEKAINAGVDITLGTETLHFSLTANDQINLTNAIGAIKAGATGFPYHNDGGLCRIFSAEDITTIVTKSTKFVLYHTTYCNYLNYYIKSLQDIELINQVYYGMELPEELDDQFMSVLATI